MKKALIAALSIITLSATPAFAGAGHDHGPKYGGVVREVGAITYELVAKVDSLTLYLSDHGQPVSTAGATAELALYSGNDKTIVTLKPEADNRMSATGTFKVGVGVRAALVLTLPGKNPTKANFNLR